MKKKLLALVLGLVVAFSAISFTACGKSVFDGKYEEASKEEITAFANELKNVQGSLLDYKEGFKIEIGAGLEITDLLDMEGEIEAQMGVEADTNKILAKLTASMEGTTVNPETDEESKLKAEAKAYLADKIYLDLYAKYNDDEPQTDKTIMGDNVYTADMLDEYSGATIGAMIGDVEKEVNDLFAMLEANEALNLLIDNRGDDTKLKVEAKEMASTLPKASIVALANEYSADASTMLDAMLPEMVTLNVSGAIILVFNESNQLCALAVEFEVGTKLADQKEVKFEIDLEIEAGSGSIEMPSFEGFEA